MLHGKRQYFINGRGIKVLEPGESIFIAKGDIHKVTAIEDSVSVSFGIPFGSKKEMSPFINKKEALHNFGYLFTELPIFKQWMLV